MFEHLVNHITGLDKEQLASVPVEDLALCAAWCASHQETPDRIEPYAALPSMLEYWTRHPIIPEMKTEGRRQQPLLRILLDLAALGKTHEMTRDETDFLCEVWRLIESAAGSGLFERPLKYMRPHMAAIRERRESLPLVPDLPAIADRVTVVTLDNMRNAQSRDIHVFGGLELPVRGPVLLQRGLVKIIDGIPAECSVAVEDGGCCVRGLVLGNIAAAGACEILGNISGVVIARKGDVRAADLLNQASVISKEKLVCCRNAQEPKLVFGFKGVHIQGSALSGQYLGRTVEINQEILGGEVHVSEQVTARHFRQSERRPLAIVLRRSLNCLDYGEALSQDAGRMLNNAVKMRQRIWNLRRLAEISEREADDFAGNILLHLLGEDDTMDQMHKLQKLRRRTAFINRLVAGARAVAHSAEDQLSLPQDESSGSATAEERGILEDMQRELAVLAAEGTIDRDLFETREEILLLCRRLQRKSLTLQERIDTLKGLMAKTDELSGRAAEIEAIAQRQETQMQEAAARTAILERAKANRSRVEVLEQLLAAGKDRPGMERLMKRAHDRIVRLIRRNIENRLAHAQEYRNEVLGIEGRIRKVRDHLWQEHMVSLPEEMLGESPDLEPYACGRFEAGIRIVAWRHLVDSGRPGVQGFFMTPAVEEEEEAPILAYTRTARSAIEPRKPRMLPSNQEEAAQSPS